MTAVIQSTTNQVLQPAANLLTIPYPASIVADDLLIAWVSFRDLRTPVTPSGWNLAGVLHATGGYPWSVAYWRLASGVESGSLTIDFVENITQVSAIMARITGHDTAGPIEAFAREPDGTFTLTSPSVESAGADRLLIAAAYGGGNSTAATHTAPAGMTLVESVTAQWNFRNLAISSQTVGAGATGGKTTTVSSGWGLGSSILVRPAPVAPTTAPIMRGATGIIGRSGALLRSRA